MNHSINNLLWITLFAVLYISSVIEGDNCGVPDHVDSCSDCTDDDDCEDSENLGPNGCGCFADSDGCESILICDPPEENNCAEPGHADSCNDCLDEDACLDEENLGPDGCRCKTLNFPAVCGDATCDPTIDPTVDPTIDPTQMPTAPTRIHQLHQQVIHQLIHQLHQQVIHQLHQQHK
eukprot:156049_1